MKTIRALLLIAGIGIVAAPSLAAIYFNDFASTRDTFVGRAYYLTNSNYSTRRFGRVGKGNGQDGYIFDFDRATALSWVQGLYTSVGGGTITDVSQIGNGATKMTVYLTPYDSWEESATLPPTIFGHYYWPGVRISKGQNWDETTATYSWAATVGGVNQPWHDSAGNAIASIWLGFNYASNDTSANMIKNATSEQWGAADTLGGGTDVYVYDTPRPWLLDQSVAWAALKNPDAVGFQMVADFANKPWVNPPTGGDDDNVGSIYSRKHGLTEYRPYLEIMVDTSKIPCGCGHTYLPCDFNHDLKASFADYLILERNFGKSGKTQSEGDANGDGKVSFADYLILESCSWGHTTTPEPATIGLLVAGGLAILRRR